MFAVTCSHCGKSMEVTQEMGRKTAKCPTCGQLVQIPLGGLRSRLSKGSLGAGQTPAPPDPTPPPPEPPLLGPTTQAGGRPPNVEGATGAWEARSPEVNQEAPTKTPEQEELLAPLAPAQSADEIGRLGPYRVLKILGAGGMGVVYEAEDTQLKRHVALKAMLPGLAASPTARQRFLREAQAAAAVEHDHIIPIHVVGEDRGVPFVAMPLLKGEPLESRLERERRLPTAEVLRIGREIAEGLGAAHDRGLVHRDVKPPNVWLEGERARVKILDFGLARSASGEGRVTQSGAILGTPAYMSPEQAGGEMVDGRSDLFSLGCVLYRMCTGLNAFQGKDGIATLMAVASQHPPAPREVNPDVPAVVSDLVMHLLAKKREERPQTARAVVEAIMAIESGSPLPAGKQRPSGPRRPWLWGFVVVGLFLASLALAAMGWWLMGMLMAR